MKFWTHSKRCCVSRFNTMYNNDYGSYIGLNHTDALSTSPVPAHSWRLTFQKYRLWCWWRIILYEQRYFRASMGFLPDTWNCGMRMRRECRERFPCHRLRRKPLVSDSGMHRGTCVTHVPWCMSGSLTRGGGENVPGIPGACATHHFTYLVRGPFTKRADVLPQDLAKSRSREIGV